MKNNEIHFSTQTEYTFEEYVRFSNRYCRFANFMSYLVWLGVGTLLIIFACYRQEYVHALMVLLVCISLVIKGEKTRKKKQIEEYNSPGSPKGSLFTFDFYSDCFQQTCDNLESEPLRYYDLLKIIETKTNFYLIYAKQEGCIIIKENCSPELIRFLHELRAEPNSPLYNEDKEAKISYKEITASIIDKIGCPCEILDSFQSTKKITERYRQALANAEKEISSEQDAWDLAKEHLAFCNDRVYQCTDSGTLGELADSLMKSHSWYFWWD